MKVTFFKNNLNFSNVSCVERYTKMHRFERVFFWTHLLPYLVASLLLLTGVGTPRRQSLKYLMVKNTWAKFLLATYKDRQDCVPNAIKCYKKVDSKDVNLKRKLYSFSVLTNCKSNRAHIPFTTQKIRTYAKCLKGQIAFEPQIGNWIYGSDKVVACYVKSPTENRSCILLYILLHRSSD